MKRIILLLTILLWNWNSYAQNDTTLVKSNTQNVTPSRKLPNSFLNVGLGLGTGYGFFGTKVVFGFKNSGLCLGLGKNGPNGGLGYNIGLQLSYKSIYTTFCYGTYAYTITNPTGALYEPRGFHNAIGVMISLGKAKRTFIDLGFHISYGGSITTNSIDNFSAGNTPGITTINYSGAKGERLEIIHMGFVIGINYRFGNKILWKKN